MSIRSLIMLLCCSFAYAMEQAEIDKVNTLIDKVGTMTTHKFIRNGSEYDVADAVKLMKYKLDDQKKDLKTLDDYIDTCLTKSSSSGKVYQIKDDKGTVTDCAAVLKKWAKELAEKKDSKEAKSKTEVKKPAEAKEAK